MKRWIFVILTATLLLCSCGAGYGKAYRAFEKTDCTVRVQQQVHIEGSDGQTEDAATDMTLTRADGVYFARTDDDGVQSTYYYKDGTTYSDMGEIGKYRQKATTDQFFNACAYAPPLDADVTDKKKLDGAYVYTAVLDGAQYADRLFALNSAFADLDAQTVTFHSFTYTATLEKGRLTSYEYAFSFSMPDDTHGTLTVTDTVRATVVETQAFDFPSDVQEYTDIDEETARIDEEWREQMMYVIFESLYNADGTKSEKFDAYYKQFEQLYGSDTMERIVEIADMFRGATD